MFKTFPEFSKLTLADKAEYEKLIKDFPPLTDLSFAGLMIWWNTLDSLAISTLNGNLIISYWLPGDEENSGISLIGEHDVDETICAIFDQLIGEDKPARLVHVPEFTVQHLRYPHLFNFTPEPHFDESVYSTLNLSTLSKNAIHRRTKIEKFISTAGKKNIKVTSLDLALIENQQILLDFVKINDSKGPFKAIAKLESEVLPTAITKATLLGIENICIYVHDELYGFLFYELPKDDRYVITTFIRSKAAIPGSAEFVIYAAAQWFNERGIPYMNLEQDFGLPVVRAEKLSLGPVNYFRKYSVRPL